MARLADAEAHLLRGAWHEATTASRAAVQHASRWGYASREAHPRRRIAHLVRVQPLLWRLLEVLWDHGGEASKEELVREGWAQPDYHPLRDDNRLHVTIRKLRGLLMDGQPPARILTRDEGYALGGAPVRVR